METTEIKLNIKENYPLSELASFRCGGPADRLVTVESVEELRKALLLPNPMIVGNCTNILFPDEGLRGSVIRFGAGLSRIEVQGCKVRAGAGALLSAVSRAASNAGLKGLEFACGIPGSVGGAVIMNAGAYDGCMADVVTAVESSPAIPDFGFGYRRSNFKDIGAIVLSAEFTLTPGNPAEIEEKIRELSEKRRSKQPLQYPSAGSFFKRPEGYFAGKLIEDAGLKGFAVGGAQVSELHAGFVINRGGASSEDIKELMRTVQSRVFDKFGVMLEPEVLILDEFGAVCTPKAGKANE